MTRLRPDPARAATLALVAFVAGITALTYFQFPGHTWLQSDTQIYLPILEHFRDPSVLRDDLIAQKPHVSFTIYDEVALGLERLTGLEFVTIVTAQQILYRALGVLGIYLLGTALGLSRWLAMLVAAAGSLGATIAGPSVLAIEYEPVPRGYAIPLVLLALGLAAHGRDLGAGIAGTLAFLYHAPAAFVFWAMYFVLTLWPSKPAIMSRRILGLAPLACGVVLLLALSRWQVGPHEPQMFFERIPPELEKLQRLRANYNWVGVWTRIWIGHYVFLWAVSAAALVRIRKAVSEDLKFFLIGLPLLGFLSLPVSYLLLDRMKWGLIPQAQPARALLFVTLLAAILAAVAGARAGRFWESLLWFLPVFAIPAHTRVLELLWPANPLLRRRALLVLLLASLAAVASWAIARGRRWAAVPWAAALLVPFFAIPHFGQVRNYPSLHTPELRQLSDWARSSTQEDAIFLFPDARQDLDPGIFRVKALRTVYVDWKAGGQINYLKSFAGEWWRRWTGTMQGKLTPQKVPELAGHGIEYIVLRPANRLPDRSPVFENARYVVYRLAKP